jgi:predicted phage terminase large subunit-like protein
MTGREIAGMSEIPTEIPIRDMLKSSPYYFINKVFGYRVDGCHEKMLNFFLNNQHGMLLCPRGSGKSKIAQSYIAWLALHNPDMRIIIVSDSDGKATLFMNTIKNVLEYSPIIQEPYGDVKGNVWTDHAITIKGREFIQTEPTVMSVGSGSGRVTGLHADLILMDDIESFDSSRSQVKRDRLQDWYKTTLSPVLMSDGSTMVCATRYHQSDIYQMLLDEFDFNQLILPAIGEDGQSICVWLLPLHDKVKPDGKILKGLDTIKANLGSVIYALQYSNDVELLKAGTIFKYEDFRFYNRVIFENNNIYVELLDGRRELIKKIVIGGDLAISEKQSADFTCFMTIGKSEKGNIYILSYINQRLSFNKQIELIENLVIKWTPNEVVIEQVAYQAAFIDELRRRGGLKIIPITPTRDKVARAYLVSGMIESNLVHFKQAGMSDVTDNLTVFPDGEHDDITDAFVYGVGRMKHRTIEPISISL